MEITDAKKIIETAVDKAKNDPKFAAKFMADPLGTVEGLTGIDLPDDQINPIINGIKEKISSGAANAAADSVKSALGGLFGGKK